MSKYDIFDFKVGRRRTGWDDYQDVIWFRIKLGNNEFYELGFFTKENIEKLKEAIKEFEK